MNVFLWIVAAVLAAAFVLAGLMKATATHLRRKELSGVGVDAVLFVLVSVVAWGRFGDPGKSASSRSTNLQAASALLVPPRRADSGRPHCRDLPLPGRHSHHRAHRRLTVEARSSVLAL
jgi:hypothetical protein